MTTKNHSPIHLLVVSSVTATNMLSLPVLSTKSLVKATGSSSTEDEQQLALEEQLMLDREAYTHGSQY
jgi:hypothetical protein